MTHTQANDVDAVDKLMSRLAITNERDHVDVPPGVTGNRRFPAHARLADWIRPVNHHAHAPRRFV
jgi:hypothetical protein